MADSSKTVGFKVSGELLSTLEAEASRLGISIHEVAKTALTERLSGTTLHTLQMEILSLKGTVAELRKDVAVAVEALLVTAGKVPQNEAEKFVNDNLRSV